MSTSARPLAAQTILAGDRYTIITSDAHAGASLLDYKPYLAKEWHDDFDVWAADFVNPYGDKLLSAEPTVNWDSDERQRCLEADGVVAEVIFPNTVPPFYPYTSLMVPPPPATDEEYRARWAGIQAHNRWLADFCAQAPGRRAGVAQVLLDDIDDTLDEIRATKEANLTGGILLPGITPGSRLPGLWNERYEPVWALCEELEIPVHHHGGGGGGDYGLDVRGQTIFFIESHWFTYRALWHLMFAGVFERHPGIKYVLTELGAGWVPGVIDALEFNWHRFRDPRSSASFFGAETAAAMPRHPKEYFRQSCYLGASFLHPVEAEGRHEIGADRLMWGSDFPHKEGSYPYTVEILRATFSNVPPDEVQLILGGTAAGVYGFDLQQLALIAARVGPSVNDVATPIDRVDLPSDSGCNALAPHRPMRLL